MREKLKILLWSSFFINLSAGLLGPIYAIFVEEIGGDILTAGTSYAVFSIATGVLIFFLGKWEDKLKHQENILIIGRVLAVIGTAGYLFVKSPLTLFGVQILLGVSEALITPAFDGIYSRNLSKGKFASQWGYWDAMVYVTIGASAILGAFIADVYSFRILFIFMTIMAFLSLVVALILKKEIKKILQ